MEALAAGFAAQPESLFVNLVPKSAGFRVGY
jgi:hypothetical protein